MSANIEQIKAMLERARKTNLLQKQKVDLDKERLQLEATVNTEKMRQDIEQLRREVDDHNYYLDNSEQALGYSAALDDIEKFLDTISEEPVQKFNIDKLQEVAKPATPSKKPTPEDRAKFMKELHEYAENKKPDKSLEEEIETVWGEYEYYNEDYDKVAELNWSEFNKVIKHFYDLGQSQMPMPEDTVLFQKGVEEGYEQAEKDLGWHSVDESLPPVDEEVIVLTDELYTAPIYKISIGHIVDQSITIDYSHWNIPGVKYWMPMPKLPEEEK